MCVRKCKEKKKKDSLENCAEVIYVLARNVLSW